MRHVDGEYVGVGGRGLDDGGEGEAGGGDDGGGAWL